MNCVTSVSGGKTSAYIAANYPSEHLVFALVRTDDPECTFKDRKIAKQVEDRIQKPFVGTLEDDTIIYTMLDLEQHLGQKIDWVSGITFDQLVRTKGGWLPNVKHRYCTSHLKIEPIFYWWADKFAKEPVLMNIGYRAGEGRRVNKMLTELNENGLSEFKATFGKHQTGRHKGNNKWEMVEWRTPRFPLYEDRIYKDEVEKFWDDKPVRFAERNNCIGCFHRNANLLKKQSIMHPKKFDWFASQEGGKNGYWRSDISYKKIKKIPLQAQLNFHSTANCESGFCGV